MKLGETSVEQMLCVCGFHSVLFSVTLTNTYKFHLYKLNAMIFVFAIFYSDIFIVMDRRDHWRFRKKKKKTIPTAHIQAKQEF